jgi:cohesin loading factor subunit SCC2
VVQAIESTLHINTDVQFLPAPIDEDHSTGASHSLEPQDLDPAQLKKLATAATILTMLWETRSFLKRQYGIGGDVRQALSKIKKDKETSKLALKVHGVTGERYWNLCSVLVCSQKDINGLVSRCKKFGELMAVNDEVKVAADDVGTREIYSTSVDLDESTLKPGNGGSRKRKRMASVGGTPLKKGRPSLNKSRRSSTGSREDLEADLARC